jgi:hypothetical protein
MIFQQATLAVGPDGAPRLDGNVRVGSGAKGEFALETMPKSEPIQWYFMTSRLAQLRRVCQRD